MPRSPRQPGSHRLEGADELATDDLAFLFRFRDPGQSTKETLRLVSHHQVHSSDLDEILLDLFGLPLTQEAVVDENTGQL